MLYSCQSKPAKGKSMTTFAQLAATGRSKRLTWQEFFPLLDFVRASEAPQCSFPVMPPDSAAPFGCKKLQGRKTFSSTVLGSLAGSENEADEDRVTEEEHTHFTEFSHVDEILHRRIKTWRAGPGQQASFGQRNNTFLNIGKPEGFAIGVMDGEEVTRKLKLGLTSLFI